MSYGLFTLLDILLFYPGVHYLVICAITVFIFYTKTTRLFFPIISLQTLYRLLISIVDL